MTVLDKIFATFHSGRDILELDGRNLTELPPQIGMLANLQVLSLSNNQITCLPSEIGNLSNLVELALDRNCLTVLPVQIGHLSRLETLLLSYNNLRTLPASIGDLASLRTLNLDHNELLKLPPEIGKLGKLHRLNIQYNRLTELPEEFAQIDSLNDFDWKKWEASKSPRKGLPPRHVRNFIANGNTWIYPPAEIMKQEVNVIRDYLKGESLDNPLLNGNGMNVERWASPPPPQVQADIQSGAIPHWTPPACPVPPPLPRIISTCMIPEGQHGFSFQFQLVIELPARTEPHIEARLRREFPECKWQDHSENWDKVYIEGISQNSPRGHLKILIMRKEFPGPFQITVTIEAQDQFGAEKVHHQVTRRLIWAFIGWSPFPLPQFKPRPSAAVNIHTQQIVNLSLLPEVPKISLFRPNADVHISRTLIEALSLHLEVLGPWAKTLPRKGNDSDDQDNQDALFRGKAARLILRQSTSMDGGQDLHADLNVVRQAQRLIGELLELGLARVVLYGNAGRAPGSGRSPNSITVKYHFGDRTTPTLAVDYISYTEDPTLDEFLRLYWQES